MSISTFKIAWKLLWGGMESVVDYLLEVVNAALDEINPEKRAKIAAAYNTISRVASTLLALKWLCPTKWQSAYEMTIMAISDAGSALEDFKIETAELTKVKDAFAAAVTAWRAGDIPDTDVDFDTIDEED